jgi:phage terminase Nu1 subunit (DNA packaging protein)
MPTIFWFGVGGIVLSILLFLTGDWVSGIGTFLVTGLACGFYEKLEEWGFVTTTYKTKVTQPEARSMASVISDTLQPRQPNLPPPNVPSPHTSPVKGIMRVDITQTPQTVDVYITLSEQSKFLVDNNHLGSVPIEQNFEKLSEHMADFRGMLGSAYDETDANIAAQLSGDALEGWKKTNAQWRAEEKARQPHEIKEEEQRYKEQNTIYLRDYLQNPYRKIVDNPLQASQFLKRLETDYLPKIKATIEGAAPSQTKSYEF